MRKQLWRCIDCLQDYCNTRLMQRSLARLSRSNTMVCTLPCLTACKAAWSRQLWNGCRFAYWHTRLW